MCSHLARSGAVAARTLLIVCTLATACVTKPAPVVAEPVELSPRSWLGQRKPDQSFELRDGRQLLVWQYTKLWSELESPLQVILVVTDGASDDFRFTWTACRGGPLSWDEINEIIDAVTPQARRVELAARIFPPSAVPVDE